MMGYTYKDIQEFGKTLTNLEYLVLDSKEEGLQEGIHKIWDFFEGLLGEGYIAEEVSVND
jgi:hypothetical protein